MFRGASSMVQRRFPAIRPWLIWLNFKLRGRRISRNQWADEAATRRYEDMMRWSWEETRQNAPDYFKRLGASVAHARGNVLELGCGVGTMTRWIAAAPAVKSVLAVDGFEAAISRLNQSQLPGVEARCVTLEKLELPAGRTFDTVFLCEFIEHLYPDEEAGLLQRLRPYLAPDAGFVVSVPIGWLEDPSHVRAFSRGGLVRHLRKHYGEPAGVDVSSGYSQVAWGAWHQRGRTS